MTGRSALLRTLLRLILAAAVLSAPLFLLAEAEAGGLDAEVVGRVAASNGVCVVLCAGLLVLERRGSVLVASRVLVWSLMVLVGSLAWGNGEPVHVNVINFTLVTVLASVLLGRGTVAAVAAISGTEMAALAWSRPLVRAGEELGEARVESLVQILPTFCVVSVVLWLSATRPSSGTPR